MSKLSLTPNGAGTGTYTLASPNNNASHTLTLPVATGELLTSTGDGSGLTALTSGNLTGALPAIDGSALTSLTSGNLTGALPAISGAALTGISAGGLRFISSTDLSSDATADFTGFAAGTYDSYVFDLSNVIPASDNVNLLFRTSTNGGATYDATSGQYEWANSESRVGTSYTALGSASSGSTAIQINCNTIGSAAGEGGVSGSLQLFGPHLAQETCCTFHGGIVSTSGNWANVIGQGARLSAADVDAVRFLMSSGSLESGTITMYGKVNS